jgi:pyruvate dehydrogenase E2 component (dihydrolipoamide acetyltransferase)
MSKDQQEGEFRLPDLGEGLLEAEIVTWHVQAGDHVVADQPLVAVETDKAIVEIPSPRAGRVATLAAGVGDRLQVGDVLVTFVSQDVPQPDTTTIVGSLEQPLGEPVVASPRARQRAQQLGVNLSEVTATGPDGVVQESDVEHATDASRLTGVRRAMAERMAEAHARVARASVTGEADVSAWVDGTRTMPRLIRAIGVACLQQPRLNARFDDEAFTLTPQSQVNLGIAMETDHGLFVPVLQDINRLSESELKQAFDHLEESVRDRTIQPHELRDQTITLSNFGAVGGLHAEMVVVPPQVAIVGTGRAFDRVVMVSQTPTERRFLPISITFDHRVVTGIEACDFLRLFIQNLELCD